MVKENQAITVLSTNSGWGGEYQQYTFWGPRTPLRLFLAMWNIYFISTHHPPLNIKIIYSTWYRPKSLQFGQSAQFGGGLGIYEWGWTWVKIQFCPNFGEGVLRAQKRKIFPFSNQLIENQKLYNISKNQLPMSVWMGDMRISSLFDLEKVLFLPYLPSKLSWEV